MSFFDSDEYRREEIKSRMEATDSTLRSVLSNGHGQPNQTMDWTGMVRPGAPVPSKPVSWDDMSAAPLQGDKRDLRAWAKTAEGKQAIAEYKDLNRPRPRIYEVRPGYWRYVSTRGEVWNGTDRLELLQKVVFGNQTEEQLHAQLERFFRENPDCERHQSALLYAELVQWLAENEYFFTAEALTEAWKNLKHTVDNPVHRAAAKGYDEYQLVTSKPQVDDYTAELTADETNEAFRIVHRVRGTERD